MTKAVLHGKRLWVLSPDHKVSGHELDLVERQRVCPYCGFGDMNRLAERQFHAPYRWIPIGYRCNKCGATLVSKENLV